MPRKAEIRKKQTGLWHRSRFAEIAALDEKANSLLAERDNIRMRIPNLLHEAYLLVMMNPETLNIPCTVRNRNLVLTLEPIMSSLK